jgi:murein DD-endopeptidase MepM/ murein hydrolase activator NlpD
MERRNDPRHRCTTRVSAGKTVRVLVAAALLLSASACAAIDSSRSRPAYAKPRLQYSDTTTYRVQPGDTLTSIARDFGVSAEAIMGVNRLDDPHYLRVGKRIQIPRGRGRAIYRPVRPQFATATGAAVRASPRDPDAPYAGPAAVDRSPAVGSGGLVPVLPSVKEMPQGPSWDRSGEAERVVAKPSRSFMWPVRGPVIARFGDMGSGQRNDGINIAADPDTPVRAADEGEVVYAGNELRSYGNLLLIRHPSGYITAYAHNERLLVSKSDKVKRGQEIARVGASGVVSKPQLHFEIRRGGKPVDPAPYLATETASR